MSAPDVDLEDVEWRVDSKPVNGRARFIPYVDSATVAKLLDEWVGPDNWSDSYEPMPIAGKFALACTLSVRQDTTSEWVSKTDVGVPSSMAAEKGCVSDAFKRAACLKWGVGRNVYKLPGPVWAPVKVSTNRKGEDVAYPTEATLPAIHAELKKAGLEVADEIGRVNLEAEADDGAAEAEAQAALEEARAALRAQYAFLDDEDLQGKVMERLRGRGIDDLAKVPADQVDMVKAVLDRAQEALSRPTAASPG